MPSKNKHTSHPDFAVKRSSAGLGLFAARPFKKDDFIIEYKGELITADEADARRGKYMFDINDEWVIDGKSRDNLARYINHSCTPNCEAESDEEERRVRIYAKRDIAPGEELTFDYGKSFFDDVIKPYGCQCVACTK